MIRALAAPTNKNLYFIKDGSYQQEKEHKILGTAVEACGSGRSGEKIAAIEIRGKAAAVVDRWLCLLPQQW